MAVTTFPGDLVGGRIVMARAWRQMTQGALAKTLGMAPNILLNIEKARSVPGTDRLWAIAKALQVRPDYLLGFTEQMELAESTVTEVP